MPRQPKNGKITVESRRKPRKSSGMSPEHKQKVLDWIERHRKRLGMSGAQLEVHIGVRRGWYADIKRKTHKAVGVKHDVMLKLEKLFGEKFNDSQGLQKMIAPVGKNDKLVTFGGTISIGYKETTMAARGKLSEVPASPVTKYADMQQEVWQALDGSGEPLVSEGGFVLAVDHKLVRPSPQIDDEIILRRYHPILFQHGDLSLSECTVRVVGKDESGNIVFRAPSPESGIKDIVYNPNDRSVVVEKLIIGYARYKT